MYSRISLSRAPLTRENQLVALAPWTPKFTRDCPYDRPVTHMCWCEQISPLAHSSQATWQPFNLSHCIEMHNTHLLGRAGQLSQAYFTHSAQILTPRNLPPTVNKQWPPLQESRMSRHTRFNTRRKTATASMNGVFLGTNAVYNPILYIYCVENVEILVIWNAIREFVTEKLIQLWWNVAAQRPVAHAWSHFCFLSSCDVVWLISTQNPSCVALHNVWFDSFVA